MAESSSSNVPATVEDKPESPEKQEKEQWWLRRQRGEVRENLLPWHTVAIIRVHLFGEARTKVCKEFSRTPATLRQVMESPAGKRLMKHLDEEIGDPVEFAKNIVKANALGATLDRYLALEWAKEDRDVALVDKIARDLQEKGGIVTEKKVDPVDRAGPQVIHFHFDKGTDVRDVLDAPIVKTDYEILPDEDEDDE